MHACTKALFGWAVVFKKAVVSCGLLKSSYGLWAFEKAQSRLVAPL
jgi:hypothetical protein